MHPIRNAVVRVASRIALRAALAVLALGVTRATALPVRFIGQPPLDGRATGPAAAAAGAAGAS